MAGARCNIVGNRSGEIYFGEIMAIKMRWADRHLAHYAELLDRLAVEAPNVLPRIVNQVGNRAKTQVIRNLAAQTGLPRRTIVKAVGDPATARANGRLSYEMTTRGGFIRLAYLGPRETRAGVVAKPFGNARLYPGAFMKGGKFPRRVAVPKFGGQVMRRVDKAGRRITQVRSEVRIPQEMTTGATKAAFERIAAPLLRDRVEAMLIKRFGV